MYAPFRNNKRCRYSYLNNSPSISFLYADVLPFLEKTTAVAICIWMIILQYISKLNMSSFFRNDKRCRYSYLNNSPIISFQTEDVLPFFETTSAVTICIWIIVLQYLFQLLMSSPFRNDKLCRYLFLNNIPLISFLTEDVLPFSKRQALSLFVF